MKTMWLGPTTSGVIALLAGCVAALPFVRAARKTQAAARAHALRAPRPAAPRVVLRGPLARVVRSLLYRRRVQHEQRALTFALPSTVELISVALGSGLNIRQAVTTAAQWSPPVVHHRFASIELACRHGASFRGALERATIGDALQPLLNVLAASVDSGASVAPRLAQLAEVARSDARRRAEAHARAVPVRLLFPLVFLVLPAFGLLTVAPALLAGVGGQ